ncbi:MAG: hypothetical protein H6978_16310 [Gammaproteobacteria bacterium]|nr:hypothetical protein [Gammaproteobacteria bacterium]
MSAFAKRVVLGIGIGLGSTAAVAHHAFSTEFDVNLEGTVDGTVTRVWWANPHIRYDVDIKRADGSIEQWSLHPPGNLPTYRRENWTAATLQAGDHVLATGNLGRDGARKLYATCIQLDNGRSLGRCVNPGSTSTVTADPNTVHTYQANDYAVDISGFWDNRYQFQTTVDDMTPKPMPMTAATRTIYENRKFGDDHVLRCQPPGLPRIFGSPYPMEILDAGTHYTMVYLQDNTPRWVYMDGRDPLPDQPLTAMGFSRGRWEGRTLVIETTHLVPGWLDGSGYPMTGGDGTRIEERWTVAEDGLTMARTMTVHDAAYTAPLVRTRGSQRGDTRELLESPPCDATPFYYELLERGELEQRLRPSD